MTTARPWTIDAGNAQGHEGDIEGFRARFVHETTAIREFLDHDEADPLFIVAPKGYGKTLLLQAKRLLLQRDRSGLFVSPVNQLVDRPQAVPPIWRRRDHEDLARSYAWWFEVWGIAIRIAVLQSMRALERKAERADTDAEPEPSEPFAGVSRELQLLFDERRPVNLSDVFLVVLHLDRNRFFQLRDLVVGSLHRQFRAVHTPVAFFLDNIDECFHAALQGGAGDPLQGGDFSRDQAEIWTLAQLGLAKAAFEVNRANPHIRVFATLRREAWGRLKDYDPNAMQLDGRSVRITYSTEDLHAIFRKNIENEARHNLAAPESSDPVERFVGTGNLAWQQVHSRQSEAFLDFVLRHTLRRPRELMVLGRAIHEIGPRHRTQARLRDAVFQSALASVEWYLGEMSLFARRPDPMLFRLIDRNVLGLSDLERIAQRYLEARRQAPDGSPPDEEDAHPFCALYRLGLLGVVRSADEGDPAAQVQSFAGPDDVIAERRTGILPQSRHYLIHPSLDALVERSHGHAYAQRFDVHNIVGPGRPWRDAPLARFVLKGDIVGSSFTVRHPELALRYPLLFRAWVEDEVRAHAVALHRIEAGDSLLLVDPSAAKLLLVAQALVARLQGFADLPRTMRWGAASGIVNELEPHDGPTELTGRALVTAERLQAQAPHGGLLATDAFWQDAARSWPRPAERLAAEFRAFRHQGGKFLVRKNRNDEGAWEALWRVRLG